MPASQTQQEPSAARLLPVLFWAGVGLAPLAALLILIGPSGGGVRFGAALGAFAVVLIGLSIGLRKDADTVRDELEETFLDEMELLRGDLRQDISTAARATHRQLSERLQLLHETVEALRGQLETTRYERPEPVAAGDAGPAAAPRQSVAPRQFAVPSPAPSGHAGHASVGPGQAGAGHRGHAAVGNVGAAHVGTAGASPPVVGGGVVRHTETVQVTTRHTVVDPHADAADARGTVYGGNSYGGSSYGGTSYGGTSYGGNSYGGTSYGRGVESDAGRSDGQWAQPPEESWTEQRLRERYGGQRGVDPHTDDPRDAHRSRLYDRDDDPGSDDRWSGMRAGDRWAEVRTDDRGRELRVGERRAAMHSDQSGTELRIEDRWASVRREEPRRWGSEERWSEDRWGPEVEDTGRWSEHQGQPALPAGGGESSWGQDWESDRSQAGGRAGRRRYRDDDEDEERYGWESELRDPPPRVRQRRADFEMSDDRWR